MRLTAKTPITLTQKLVLGLVLAFLVIGSFLSKSIFFYTLLSIHIFYSLFIMFKVLVFMGSFGKQEKEEKLPSMVAPIYTILLPVFKEANGVNKLINNISALEWPKTRLQVLLLVEYNDKVTQDALNIPNLPPYVQVVIIPKGDVQTKPNACQYAIENYVTGEYTVIYDAEDVPEKDQLKKAFAKFYHGTKDLACVQAKLNYYNRTENWLSALFTVDYTTWFDGYIRGLSYFNLPIPLGGTSNHFRTSILKKVGGYDKYNVTEDADLGITLNEMGYRTEILDSTTWEEAMISTSGWIKQRTRWTLGYIITSLVHARQSHKNTDAVAKLSTFLFVTGTPLSNLFVLPCFFITVTNYYLGWFGFLFTGYSGALAFLIFWVANLSMILISMIACLRRKYYVHSFMCLLLPVYWFMQAIATYRAVWKLFTAPHKWEKSQHGLTKVEIK